MPESQTLRNVIILGELKIPIFDAARADTPANGTIHAYRTGATIVIQMYDALHATPAWRSITLT